MKQLNEGFEVGDLKNILQGGFHVGGSVVRDADDSSRTPMRTASSPPA